MQIKYCQSWGMQNPGNLDRYSQGKPCFSAGWLQVPRDPTCFKMLTLGQPTPRARPNLSEVRTLIFLRRNCGQLWSSLPALSLVLYTLEGLCHSRLCRNLVWLAVGQNEMMQNGVEVGSICFTSRKHQGTDSYQLATTYYLSNPTLMISNISKALGIPFE